MSKKSPSILENSPEIKAPYLTKEELLERIYEIIKKYGKLSRYKQHFKTVAGIKDDWNIFCATLISNNLHLDFVNLLIEHSIQNGFTDWIDINKTFNDNNCLLNYSIRYPEYDIFKKLIALNANYLSIDKLYLATSIRIIPPVDEEEKWKLENELEIKRKMTVDLLKLWAPINKEIIENILRFSDAGFLQLIADSEQWKKLLTTKFLKSLIEDGLNQHFLKNRLEMQTMLMTLYNKQKVIEIIEDEKWKDEVEKVVSITKEQIKKKVGDIVVSSEFIAEIVEEILKEKWEEIEWKAIDLIKQKLIKNPGRILEGLFRY